jgi:phosphoenolpyruvate carboxylase
LRRVDTALKNIGINERVPYNAPLIQFSSWMGGDRDGMIFSFYENVST